MESLQKYGLRMGVVSLVLLVLVLGVYFVNDISKGNTQTLNTKASTAVSLPSNFSLIRPRIGEEIKGKGIIEIKFKTTKNPQNLKGVFKIGEGLALPLTIKAIDDQSVLVFGDFDTENYKKGQYYIKIYLYDTENDNVTGIGDAEFPIVINNP